ncbi:TPA: phage regulatory CII family protein [Vibrio parahaemolyticus]|uniref:phage regulatory CII family protein n=1 Tax=Vibrio parahaemolyticus TaxID=670 RepID=UPI001124AFB9|nr:phage regulatory CII family protein [Vibrio parahaemolyticus]EKB1966825.1 phage regulatory CII family protein [Vibrio parahaemolyticus]MBE4282891.1 transcriptional regulator [Vibrio parahaemolyticus]MBE5199006.1 transcriptional regulator [Vibrio parahaemolyticus]TOH06752.1 transcriptional regulator [Vibrio parahaemolyticus]TOP14868.1 transcriptional regulator [Vibrio parahaemolyticus]
MGANNSMYVLRERKQQAFDAACCDFVVNHDCEAIGRRIGVEGQVIRNMLNPAQPRVLTPIVLSLISRDSADYSIVNTLFAGDGVVTIPLPKVEEDLNLLERVLQLNTHSGELSSDAMAMCTTERLPRSRKRKTLAKAQAALGNLVLLINDLENRTTGLQPLMQIGTDFLANGAPLPGLA